MAGAVRFHRLFVSHGSELSEYCQSGVELTSVQITDRERQNGWQWDIRKTHCWSLIYHVANCQYSPFSDDLKSKDFGVSELNRPKILVSRLQYRNYFDQHVVT